MWKRAFMRLLSLSFMTFFITGLLWQEGRRREEPAARKRPAEDCKDDSCKDDARR